MSVFDRTTPVSGPAIITFDSQVYFVNDKITVKPIMKLSDRRSDQHGLTGWRRDQIGVEITFTPYGKWGLYTKLWPSSILTPIRGTSMCGATDKDVTIQTIAGQLETWKGGFISKPPAATFSAEKSLWGSVTIKCYGANTTAWTDAAKRAVIASQAYANATFVIADELIQPYTLAWGAASPWDAIETKDGITVTPTLKTTPRKSDTFGEYDELMDDVEWRAKFTPVGQTEAQILTLLKLQGSGVVRGSLISDVALPLNISGTGVYVRLYLATPIDGALVHGGVEDRVGELEFVANPWFTSGVKQPFVYAGTAAPA